MPSRRSTGYRKRSPQTIEKQAIKEIEQTVERVDEIADSTEVIEEIGDIAALRAENDALREENAFLDAALTQRNDQYSALLARQTAVSRVDAGHFDRTRVPQPLSFNAAQERTRRNALKLMPKQRLIALAMKFDGRTQRDLDKLGHPELVDLVATTESRLRQERREAARS